MFEKTEKLWEQFRKILHIFIMLGFVCSTVYLLYVHRIVIKAAVTGEPMPECPHKHHCHGRKER